MVQEAIAGIESNDLSVYIVWEPILKTDDERSSRKATTLIPDERVVHYWAPTREVGVAFQEPIGLTTEPAWDVYLLYAPGAPWHAEAPPGPGFFMHQLRGRLPDGAILDSERLHTEIETRIP